VIVRDSRDIQDLGLKPTFAGRVLSEETKAPRTVFACQAASVEAVKKAMQKNVWLKFNSIFDASNGLFLNADCDLRAHVTCRP
jgi:hypothetical protein